MKAEQKKAVIEVLNKARSMELNAIHQYMNQHYMLDDKDFGELAANMKLIAIDEMRHAEDFAERIKSLGGEPTTKPAKEVVKGQAIVEVYTYDRDTEEDTIQIYTDFMQVCRDNCDNISARLFEAIIDDEEAHKDYFDKIFNHIDTLGNAYLAKVAGTPSDTGPKKGFTLLNNAAE